MCAIFDRNNKENPTIKQYAVKANGKCITLLKWFFLS